MMFSYVCRNDFEMRAIEMKMKSQHSKKVLNFYDQTSTKARKMLELSDEITQELYSVLSDNRLITDGMREKIADLYRIHDQQSFDHTEIDDALETLTQYLFDDDFLLADTIVAAHSQREVAHDTNISPTNSSIAIQPNLNATLSNEDNTNSTIPNKPITHKLEPKAFSPRSERKPSAKSIKRDHKRKLFVKFHHQRNCQGSNMEFLLQTFEHL